jgi:hypothetical protein
VLPAVLATLQAALQGRWCHCVQLVLLVVTQPELLLVGWLLQQLQQQR